MAYRHPLAHGLTPHKLFFLTYDNKKNKMENKKQINIITKI